MTGWLAERVARAGAPAEPWFTKAFSTLVAREAARAGALGEDGDPGDAGETAVPIEPLKREFRTLSASVDMSFVRP